ncbi:orotidine-5'-phosphate decarboxylase [Chamberlinius hualienensis]
MTDTFNEILTKFIKQLYDIESVKFGTFTLKYGLRTPIYVDLRTTVSYPDMLNSLGELLWQTMEKDKVHCDLLCGVPYAALPIATCVSVQKQIPMVFRRKEVKGYGTRKLLEGHYHQADSCVIIEDVVVSGQSILETAEALRSSGIRVTDAVAFLDREQGAKTILEREGVKLHCAVNLSELLAVLYKEKIISSSIVDEVMEYIQQNQCLNIVSNKVFTSKPKMRTYSERAEICRQPVSKELLQIMETKRTNLAFAADFHSCEELLKTLDQVGPYICLVKLHVELLSDFTKSFIPRLQSLAENHNFLIYEDHKFSDIGSIVHSQYEHGFYGIVNWAHLTNAHPLPGPTVLHGLKKSGLPKKRACVLIAEMSSAGSLWTQDYVDFALRLGELNDDFVIGFVCQSQISSNPRLINFIPGVKLEGGMDDLGQHYLTPSEAILKKGGDVIVVGRGISGAADPAAAARQYRDAGYAAYTSLF